MCKKCSYCGTPIEEKDWHKDCTVPKIMKDKGFCYICAFWQEKIDLADENTLVVDGVRFQCSLVDRSVVKGFLGCGGVDMYFQMLDNPNDVRHYNNCWCQGDIPEIWKDKIPNNARKINAQTYYSMKEGQNKIGKKLVICCDSGEFNNPIIEVFEEVIQYNSNDTFCKFLDKNKDKYNSIIAISDSPIGKVKMLTYNWAKITGRDNIRILEKKVDSLPKELIEVASKNKY